jgi:hypothetical protein
MGIAAGFVCADGILLAAEIALTDASDKWPQRCFFERVVPRYRVALTGSGNADLVRMAFDHLARELDEDDDLDDIWERAEKLLNRMAKKYLFCYDAGDARRPELRLLIAARMQDGRSLLLKTDENRVSRVEDCVFVGPGSALAATVASWLYEPSLSSQVVSSLVAQILFWVRQHGAECGTAARVLTLREGASPEDAPVVSVDQFFWGVHASLRPILTGCLDPSVSDVEFDDRLRWFEEKMSAVRQALRQSEPSVAGVPAPRKDSPGYE